MKEYIHFAKKRLVAAIAWLTLPAICLAQPAHKITLHPDKEKQVILGLGFEIQSDSIGSGNNGLPEEPLAVPHDLVQSERDRFATEMLKGFRYCRLAGGLYWRGLDPEQKYLQPRWPEQLEELRHMLELAGVEGLSFEYWSPAPFWKSSGSYIGGTLRCFGEDFHKDPVYQGDQEKFLEDFAQAVVTDIETLKAAGIDVSMFGLQNEPNSSSNKYIPYSTCKYRNWQEYVAAFKSVASAVREYDSSIMIIADTVSNGYPHLIGPAMKDPEVADLVDAYALHTIGWDSSTVKGLHNKLRRKLPYRPWFQNEYEYLKGVTTPARCLNTVQHIMNSFQIAENPSWFWLHALKPFKNSEASGYSLGFWNSRIEPQKSPEDVAKKTRWTDGPEYTYIPEVLADADYVSVSRVKGDSEFGRKFSLIVKGHADVYLVTSHALPKPPQGFVKTELYTEYGDGIRDVIYKKTVKGNGAFRFPANTIETDGRYAPPHAVFVKGISAPTLSGLKRTSDQFAMAGIPDEFYGMQCVTVQRGNDQKPGAGYAFTIDKPTKVYIAVHERGDITTLAKDWTQEELAATWSGGGTRQDMIYSKWFEAGPVTIPGHSGKNAAGYYGVPHLAFVAADVEVSGLPDALKGTLTLASSEPTFSDVKVEPGINSPIQIRSEAMKSAEIMATMKPGHWIYNDYNWNAVGSFVKRMPWDSIAIDITDHHHNKDAKAFCFKRPNGKLTVVVSNRLSKSSHRFEVATGLPGSSWKGFRYTPQERGEGTMGVPIGTQQGATLSLELGSRSWEFWEQQ